MTEQRAGALAMFHVHGVYSGSVTPKVTQYVWPLVSGSTGKTDIMTTTYARCVSLFESENGGSVVGVADVRGGVAWHGWAREFDGGVGGGGGGGVGAGGEGGGARGRGEMREGGNRRGMRCA